MKYIALAIAMFVSLPLYPDYSSLTSKERADIITALDMSAEYRILLDKEEARRIVECVNVDGESWRIRIEFGIKTQTGTNRLIIRDVYVKIKPASSSPSWPWIIASGAAGILIGVFAAK